jgi:two-component system KDP operon response regulator KdpE
MRFLDAIRQTSAVPVIVLSARSDERDKVEALDAGANDYVTKPFGSAELLARVRSTLRNHRHSSQEGRLPGGKFSVDELVIDYDARQIFIQGEEVKLTQTEYNIVALLSEHCGKVLTYSAIIKAIWGYPDEGSIKKLQVNMANIRKKFGAKPGKTSYISNELGVGYRMNGERE